MIGWKNPPRNKKLVWFFLMIKQNLFLKKKRNRIQDIIIRATYLLWTPKVQTLSIIPAMKVSTTVLVIIESRSL